MARCRNCTSTRMSRSAGCGRAQQQADRLKARRPARPRRCRGRGPRGLRSTPRYRRPTTFLVGFGDLRLEARRLPSRPGTKSVMEHSCAHAGTWTSAILPDDGPACGRAPRLGPHPTWLVGSILEPWSSKSLSSGSSTCVPRSRVSRWTASRRPPWASSRRGSPTPCSRGRLNPTPPPLPRSTVCGHASVRMMLVKVVDARGFCFFTNHGSRKGRDLDESGRAALLFPWHGMHRQVAVRGEAHRLPRAESEQYFAPRPRGAQLGAWASQQSQEVTRTQLDEEGGRAHRAALRDRRADPDARQLGWLRPGP